MGDIEFNSIQEIEGPIKHTLSMANKKYTRC
jgi:hypothetical protein